MARRKFIAGNWKMNKTVDEALDFIKALKPLVEHINDQDILIAPPYTALWALKQQLANSPIQLGAQELYPQPHGAFTGAISALMLKSIGCTYVLVGHSERRQVFGETLSSSQTRVAAAIDAGLLPLLCIGETLEERVANKTLDIVCGQLDAGLDGLDAKALEKVTLAYEPVWAIGTGKVATAQQAQEVHAAIRGRLHNRNPHVAESMRILYGGSVNASNAQKLFSQQDIDGALVGGASLDPQSFAAIAQCV